MLPEYIQKFLHKIAKTEGFTDYKFETAAGSNHGDNFLGVMTTVTLSGNKGKNGMSRHEELHLICKSPPSNETRKKNFKSNLVFDREVFMYSKVLPAFMQFQTEKGLSETDSFLSYPKVYVCEENFENDSYILIMEDMRPKHYQMWPKEETVPVNHELIIMRELGKLHAISFAMKDQRPNEFHEFTGIKDIMSELVLHGNMRSFLQKSIERAANVLKNPEHKKLMLDFRKVYVETIDDFLIGSMSKEFAVIGHGDSWNNNFLYQYAGDNKDDIKSICILDWQLSRYGPPVLDLLYNIFSSTDKQFRAEHYDQLLKTYYSSLSDTIRKLGSDPNKLYTFQQFETQLKKYGQFSLLFGPMVIQLKVANAQDIGNLDEYAELVEKGEEPDLIVKFDEETQMQYSTLINDLVTDLVKYGYVKCK